MHDRVFHHNHLQAMPELAGAFDVLAWSTSEVGWVDKECGPWMRGLIEDLQRRGAVFHGYSPDDKDDTGGSTLVSRNGEIYTVGIGRAVP